jgi:hypothetical protein
MPTLKDMPTLKHTAAALEAAAKQLRAADDEIDGLRKEIARLREELAPKPDQDVSFFASFETSPTEDGALVLAAAKDDSPRATLTDFGRHGNHAVRLLTSGKDFDISNAPAGRERCDLSGKLNPKTHLHQGEEAWWAHSFMLDENFQFPDGKGCTIFDFHNILNNGKHPREGGQANLNLSFPAAYPDNRLVWILWGGAKMNTGRAEYQFLAGSEVERKVWYDVIYHIRGSSGPDGVTDIWARRGDWPTYKKYASHRGPTLYEGQYTYLKLANYHSNSGKPSAVIHDFVVREPTLLALHNAFKAVGVKLAPLEGV